MDCIVDGCERPADLKSDGKPREGGKCAAHARRARREGMRPMCEPVREYGRTGRARLKAAAIRYADAETDEDVERAESWLLKAAYRLLRRRKDIVRKPPNHPE